MRIDHYKEDGVQRDNVLVLHRETYAAAVDINIGLPLIAASVWLSFGPFDSRDDAEDWLSILQIVHQQIEEPTTRHLYSANSFMIDPDAEPTVSCFIGGTDTPKVASSFRAKGELIPSGSPASTAEKLREYALRALAESIKAAQVICS